MAYFIRGQACGWKTKLYDPSFICATVSALEVHIMTKRRYTNVLS